MFNPRIPRVKRGDPISARAWNYLCDLVERALKVTTSSPLACSVDATGVNIWLVDQYTETWVATVDSSGISARSGSGAGQGTATRQKLDTGSGAYSALDSVDVYNPFSVSFSSGTWIVISKQNGIWTLVDGDC